jgi:hypothetical protein
MRRLATLLRLFVVGWTAQDLAVQPVYWETGARVLIQEHQLRKSWSLF